MAKHGWSPRTNKSFDTNMIYHSLSKLLQNIHPNRPNHKDSSSKPPTPTFLLMKNMQTSMNGWPQKVLPPNYVPQNQIQCVGLDSITLKVGIQENYRQIYFVGAKFSWDEDHRTHATQQTEKGRHNKAYDTYALHCHRLSVTVWVPHLWLSSNIYWQPWQGSTFLWHLPKGSHPLNELAKQWNEVELCKFSGFPHDP